MLPLRSRTSWRLRALTVTCLPRDWTWAGIYHFANNRRRGHNLPEGHHGELAKNLGYRARPPVPGPADLRAAAGSPGPSGPSGPAGPWDAAGTVSHLMALIHRRQHRDELRVRHQGSQNRTALHQLPQTPGNGDFLPTFLPKEAAQRS
jgi:hypothetical protein